MFGLVVRACLALGIREPMAFYDLSEGAQSTWIEHVRNELTGAYQRTGKPKGKESVSDFAARAIAAAKARGAL